MAIAHLISQKVEEVHFSNKLNQQGQVQLQATYTFNVNLSKDGQRCVARIYQSVKDKANSDVLFCSVDMVGAFACSGVETEEDRKVIHTQCYDQLFPYVQFTVNHLMAASGIPSFQLRKSPMNADQVQVGQKPPVQEEPSKQFPIV